MDKTKLKSKVIWTFFIGFITIFAYLVLRLEAKSEIIPDALLVKYGAPYAKDIYDGSFWGLITNSLLHNNFTLFICNILFFLVAGYIIEKINGWSFLLLFGLGASIITSAAELAFSGDAGVGLTGVNFALFGYILVSRRIKWRSNILRALPWFFVGVVLFLCAEQIIQKDFKIGVYAILIGLFIGLLIGIIRRRTFYFLQVTLIVISILSIVYNPFSSEWHTVKGYQNYENGEIRQAQVHFKEAIRLSPNNVAARKNLKRIQINKLIDVAYNLHKNKDYTSARNTYIQIINLDPDNQWAIDNLAELP